MAISVPVQGIIKINGKEIKNTYNELSKEMRKVEKQLKGMTKGTAEYEEKSAELKEVATHWQEVNKDIKEQKGYLQQNTKATESLHRSVDGLKGSFDSLKNGDFKGFSDSVIGGFHGMKAGARSFFATLMANPITAVVAIIAGLVVGVGALVKKWWSYNKEIAESIRLTQEITKTTDKLADTIRNRATAMEKSFGTDFQENLKKADKLVKTFGISYDEAFDIIEKAVIKGADKNGEFFQSIEEYDVHFKKAGYSAQEFADILTAGADLNIYKDKLPDAIKEATIALTEQTKAVGDALTNAFGASFSKDILSRIKNGKTTVKDALNEIAKKAKETGLNNQQAAQLTADLFKSAGEDGGGAVKVFEALNKAVKDTNRPLSEMEQKILDIAESNNKLQASKDAFFKSDGLIKFQHTFSMVWNKIQVFFFDTLSSIKNEWLSWFDNINRLFDEFGISVSDIFDGISDSVSWFFKLLSDRSKKQRESFTNLIDGFIAFKRSFIAEWKHLGESISKIGSVIGQMIKDTFDPTKSVDTNAFNKAWRDLADNAGNSYHDELVKIKNERFKKDLVKTIKMLEKDAKAIAIAKSKADEIAKAKRKAAAKKAKENTKNIKIDNGSGDLQKAKESLIKEKRDYWNLSHSLDAKGMKKELELAKEHTKRELENLSANNEKRKTKIVAINTELSRLKAFKNISKNQKQTITKAIGNREEEKGTYENLTKIASEKKQFIIKQGADKISQIKEDYIFRDLEKLKSGHAQEQKLLQQKYELDDLTHDYSEKQKLAKKKEYQDKKLVLDKQYLISTTAKVKELLHTGNWKGRDLSKIVLSDEAKEKLKANLLEAGFEIEKINALLAKIKGGGNEGADLGLGDGITDIFGMNPDQWEGLITNLQDGKVGVQEVVAGVMILQSVWKTYQQFQQQGDEEETRRYNGMMDSKKRALKKQLDEGYISQKKYDKELEKIDKAKNKRQANLEYKKAKQEKRSALISAVISTALAVAKSLPNIALSVISGAAGAAQIALISSKKIPRPSYAKGGYTRGIGEYDKDGELAGNAHAGEWYAPKWMVKSPETAPVINWLESKRNGQTKEFPANASSSITNRVSPEEMETKTNDSEITQLMYGLVLRSTELLERLEENGIEAYIMSNEQNGKEFRGAIKKYEKLKNDNKK